MARPGNDINIEKKDNRKRPGRRQFRQGAREGIGSRRFLYWKKREGAEEGRGRPDVRRSEKGKKIDPISSTTK